MFPTNSHNRPPSDSRDIDAKFKDYIFLIDNAKDHNYSVYKMWKDCIIFASPKVTDPDKNYTMRQVPTEFWMHPWSAAELEEFKVAVPDAFPHDEKILKNVPMTLQVL